MLLAFFLHGMGKTFEGAARGLGKQNYGAVILLTGFYIVGLPLVYYFVFKRGMEMKGIWMGMVIGGILENVFYMILLFMIFDWDNICKEIHKFILSQSKVSNSKTPEL